jgi:hypothetical protein
LRRATRIMLNEVKHLGTALVFDRQKEASIQDAASA